MQTSDATRILVGELLQYEAAATANLQEQRRQAAGVLADLPELATRFETQASAISINAAFLRSIVSEMGLVGDVASAELDSLGVVELTVDGMLKQLVREWTDAGAAEREQCLGFVLSSLERHVPISGGSPPQVVIPGAGLGRLVWEVAMRGYAAVGIERAMSMMLCGSYVINHLLSHERTGRIQPYAAVGSGPCNVESAANVGREFCVPDADAAKRFASATAEADATAGLQHPHERLQVITGDFRAVARASGPCADAVLTTFLLDACGDVVGALETVHAQLKPGGVWINLGPLEYEGTAGYHASRKLRLCADELVQVRIPWPPSTVPRNGPPPPACHSSLADPPMTPDDPVRQLVRQRGFEILETRKGVRCDYTQDQFSMLQSHFNCLFIVARKHIGAATPAGAPPEPPGAGRAREQMCAAAARPLHASPGNLQNLPGTYENQIERPLSHDDRSLH